MTVVIQTENLSKSFALGSVDVEVLKNIDLAINKGEFVSIMGPSGSGKSTLLYLLGGLDKPSSGSVKVNGKELSVMDDKKQSAMRRQDIGFVFQFYNLIPNLTVEENILVPVMLDGKRLKDYQGKLDEILEVVGLSDRRRHTPRELSGGQQQRVAIARALINDPDIILADEPTGNLDSKSSLEILQLMQDISRERAKTIVQVTHSPEAAQFGTRIITVKDGCIQEEQIEQVEQTKQANQVLKAI